MNIIQRNYLFDENYVITNFITNSTEVILQIHSQVITYSSI